MQGAGDGDSNGDGYKQVNTAIHELDLSGEFEDNDNLIDTEGGVGEMDQAMFKKKMEDYICII